MREPVTTRDARGKWLRFTKLPERIVSLVPSDTYTLERLGVGDRLVGRTSFCVEPEGIERVPEIGGTKNPDVDRILSLEPDLVIMNQEENSKADVERLDMAGIRTFVSFPRRVEEGVALVAFFARLIGDGRAEARDRVRFAYQAHRDAESRRSEKPALRAFVPIWMDPLMTVHGDTYISDMLDLVGATNVFADRARRYPLAADLGTGRALPTYRLEGRDTRYPRITTEELVQRAPEVILLPDEPHDFTEKDREVFSGLDIPAARDGRIVFVSGRDLMWPGLRSLEGIDRLRTALHPPDT